jgi:hypothetical protein
MTGSFGGEHQARFRCRQPDDVIGIRITVRVPA